MPSPLPPLAADSLDVSYIVHSHLRWDFVWQRPQHLISRLGRYFEHTVFVEEPKFSAGADRPGWVTQTCGPVRRMWLEVPYRSGHVGFDDPPKLAANAKSDEEAMVHYRRVRDEIKAFVERLPGALAEAR